MLETRGTGELIVSGPVPSTTMNTSPVVLSRFASKSNPSKSHEVRRGADGVVYCTCPSWRFQKNSPSNRTCKHIESWKANTVVGGQTLSTLLGPGPEAIRAPRRSRKATPKVAPVVSVEVHGHSVTIPCPPPAECSDSLSDEPEWDSRPTSWERINKTA
jgi:hypothetical protein